MPAAEFRDRVLESAARVEVRTGTDPLDLSRSMAVTTDSRLEKLPGAVGLGAGAMAIAVGLACASFFASPESAPDDGIIWFLVVVALTLALACAACVVLARDAKSRRPAHDRYEDAWARLAVELWPAPRYRSRNYADGTGMYSRTEFLIAVRDGGSLERFERHAPFTRNP